MGNVGREEKGSGSCLRLKFKVNLGLPRKQIDVILAEEGEESGKGKVKEDKTVGGI